MSVDATLTPTARIGETAGMIWRYLASSGPSSLTAMVQEVRAPRDLIMQAIGWLAREGKIEITESGRTKTITLKSDP
jgi:hypothetical protein